ncbi:hypothetical protein AB1Y20_018703 [Prymnesium parvum]|uniref:Mitochondrial fission process protein 1 n=1 Tax=Prymnesium parvum TaxID=97485 RepID=A0AB34JT77_PRYPA
MVDLPFSARLRRISARWNPRGVLISDAQAHEALRVLNTRTPATPAAALVDAERVCRAAVHPVLCQPIPSAFRHASFLPTTSALALGMVLGKSPLTLLGCHWLYQSHAAGMRYCNYADTSRPLDGALMLKAYALSTLAACGVALFSGKLVARAPRLRLLGSTLPHAAVASAGAVSCVMNASHELEAGTGFSDAEGTLLGKSRAVARASVCQAVLFHAALVPACALLVPVITLRALMPYLLRTSPVLVTPVSATLTTCCTWCLTPLAAAMVPNTISIPFSALELDNQEKVKAAIGKEPTRVYSDRLLY